MIAIPLGMIALGILLVFAVPWLEDHTNVPFGVCLCMVFLAAGLIVSSALVGGAMSRPDEEPLPPNCAEVVIGYEKSTRLISVKPVVIVPYDEPIYGVICATPFGDE